jgi:hypothetical protein
MSADLPLGLPLEIQLLNLCNAVPNENPLEFFDQLYKTISPNMMNFAVKESKALLQKENKKNGHNVNVFLTLGADNMQRALYTGAIGSILWLNSFIDKAASVNKIEKNDADVCKKVLRSLDLPSVSDAFYNENSLESFTPNSTLRHYSYFLSNFVVWMTSGITAFKQTDKVRTNMELCRFLTGLAIESFPSIPHTAYYIGSIKTNDMFTLSEKLAKTLDFTKYMSEKSIELNQPKFVVQTENSPLVGIAGHPLANMIYGQVKNDNVKWLGVFQESEEFRKLCLNAGLTSTDVQKYVLVNGMESHKKNLLKNDPIAKFIESQHYTKEIFELRTKIYSIETDEIDEMLKNNVQ